MAKKNYKRMLVISDLHCGHQAGLTPPEFQWSATSDNPHRAKFAIQQREMWNWYANKIDELKPINILLVNGDAIDGKGIRSGGCEHITIDRNEQADIAAVCIKRVGAPHIRMTYGTAYHTGMEEDWEDAVAHRVDAESISGQDFFEVNGVVFDAKHHIGGSTIPHGRSTPMKKDKLWNVLWNAEHEAQPKSDILIRSHVHYSDVTGDDTWMGYTTLALQGWGSKFGVRQCSGLVKYGFMTFDVTEKGVVAVQWHKGILSSQKVKVAQL